MCSGRVSSSCSTSGTRRVNLVTNPVINREWGKDREVFMTSGTYPWSFVTQIFHNGQPSHGGDRKIFEVMTSTLSKETLGSITSLLGATLFNTRLILYWVSSILFYPFIHSILINFAVPNNIIIIFKHKLNNNISPNWQKSCLCKVDKCSPVKVSNYMYFRSDITITVNKHKL
jgi:hypothetical protein